MEHRCHVCEGVFTIQTRPESETGRRPWHLVRTPQACPSCGAPIRYSQTPEIGHAKDFLLSMVRHPATIKCEGHEEPAVIMRSCVRTAAEVDAFVAVVESLDVDAWLEGPHGSPKAYIRRIRTRVRSGEVGRRTGEVAERIKAELAAERARYLGTE